MRHIVFYGHRLRSNINELPKPIFVVLAILSLNSCSINVSRESDNLKQTFAYSDEIKISYEVHGSGNSKIVFLHGFGASVETWRDIQPRLAERHTLFFLDLKGFGLSSKPDDGKYSIEDQAEVVLAFLKAQHLRDVTLVGHSYGGAVSLFTYFKDRSRHDPSLIQRLVLIDAAAYTQTLPFFIDILRRPFINWIVMNLVPTQTRANVVLRNLFHDEGKLTQERIARYADFFDQPGCYNSFVESARQIVPVNPDSISALLRTIAVPTLVLWGEDDTAIPVEHGHRLHEDIPNSTLAIIPNCGHIPHEEEPEESLRAIINFLEP